MDCDVDLQVIEQPSGIPRKSVRGPGPEAKKCKSAFEGFLGFQCPRRMIDSIPEAVYPMVLDSTAIASTEGLKRLGSLS